VCARIGGCAESSTRLPACIRKAGGGAAAPMPQSERGIDALIPAAAESFSLPQIKHTKKFLRVCAMSTGCSP
jgi:hypothetical protein